MVRISRVRFRVINLDMYVQIYNPKYFSVQYSTYNTAYNTVRWSLRHTSGMPNIWPKISDSHRKLIRQTAHFTPGMQTAPGFYW